MHIEKSQSFDWLFLYKPDENLTDKMIPGLWETAVFVNDQNV